MANAGCHRLFVHGRSAFRLASPPTLAGNGRRGKGDREAPVTAVSGHRRPLRGGRVRPPAADAPDRSESAMTEPGSCPQRGHRLPERRRDAPGDPRGAGGAALGPALGDRSRRQRLDRRLGGAVPGGGRGASADADAGHRRRRGARQALRAQCRHRRRPGAGGGVLRRRRRAGRGLARRHGRRARRARHRRLPHRLRPAEQRLDPRHPGRAAAGRARAACRSCPGSSMPAAAPWGCSAGSSRRSAASTRASPISRTPSSACARSSPATPSTSFPRR